jgi:hypothetical protein
MPILPAIGRNLLTAVVVIGAFAFGFWTTERRSPATAPEQPEQVQSGAGPELLVVFVTSSGCGASQYAGLTSALPLIRERLRLKAGRAGRRFVSIGVAVDQDPSIGIEFLKKFGPFDEVISGGGWLNTGSVMFMIRDFPSREALPQLVLLERDVSVTKASGISQVNERLVDRKIGNIDIVTYSQSIKTESH